MTGKLCPGYSFLDKETMGALGLPEMVTRLVITVEMDDVARIDCTYLAPLGDPGKHKVFQERLKSFVLLEQSDEPVEERDESDEAGTDPDRAA